MKRIDIVQIEIQKFNIKIWGLGYLTQPLSLLYTTFLVINWLTNTPVTNHSDAGI